MDAPSKPKETTITDPKRRALWEKSLIADAALDADALAELFHPEAGSFRIGSLPPVEGREPVREFFKQFFAMGMFTTMKHEMIEVHDLPDVLVYEARVTYTRPNGSTLSVPYVNKIRYRDGLFASYRVFIDRTALMQ